MTNPHISVPAGGKAPGVLLLHEGWGLTADITWAADRLASAGFAVLAPDLTGAMGSKLGAIRQVRAGKGPLIDAATDALDELAGRREVAAHSRIGIVGFSMGAALSLLIPAHPRVGAIGFNYGIVPAKARTEDQVPIMAAFGARDRLLPRGGHALRRHYELSGTDLHVETYEGVGHSFMTHTSQPNSPLARRLLSIGYDERAADLAWQRLIGHLDRQLSETSEIRG